MISNTILVVKDGLYITLFHYMNSQSHIQTKVHRKNHEEV